ncbi:hypothetical protein KIPE111705_42220 [Kibdelosporangium persicum]|uniref:hypothetical protein n=1 Tax=Kibdelosporangium persicum TaxID=2698649 RepID=UPI001566BC3B|nr:hypothetical protein [Kibdelosporangium persicum]
MSRFLLNPLFWLVTILVAWIVVVTMSIASNPEGARAHSLQSPQQVEITQR